jgi:hypothetical protein
VFYFAWNRLCSIIFPSRAAISFLEFYPVWIDGYKFTDMEYDHCFRVWSIPQINNSYQLAIHSKFGSRSDARRIG